jgi:hypothetical protein
MPLSALDPIAVLAAAAASFAFGALFYTVFRRPWIVAAEADEAQIKEASGPALYIRAAVCQLVLAATLALLAGGDVTVGSGMQIGFVLWLGVVMTTMAINHGFQGKSGALTLIDGAHWLGALTVQGIVLGLL